MAFKIANNSEYEALYNAYINAGGAVPEEELKGQVSSGGAGGFEVGDVIEWPDKIQPLKVKISKNSTNTAQAFIVKVKNENVERYQLFYPSTLSKSIRELEVDAEGKVLRDKGFVRTLGTAAKMYQENANLSINDTINKMVSEHPNGMKITKVEKIDTYKYQSRETTQATRYTIDFV